MKKTSLLIVSSLLLATAATAQTEKGARFIGANVGNLSYSQANKNTSFTVSLFPSAGVFVADNFLIGTSLPLSYGSQHNKTTTQDYTFRSIDFGLSPFARYYLPGTAKHRFFGQLQVGVTNSSYRLDDEGFYTGSGGQLITYQNKQRRNNTYGSYGASLGYNYFLTPSAALELIASYNRYGQGTSDASGPFSNSSGNFGIAAGFTVFLPSKGTATAQ